MKISWESGPDARHGGTPSVTRIIIDLDPQDDPRGLIAEMRDRKGLEAFLRAYSGSWFAHWPGRPVNAEDALYLLTELGHIHNRSTGIMRDMMLAARDQWGYGWGTIAQATGTARSTAKDRIQALRQQYAKMGQWFDASGYHNVTPERAQAAVKAASERDDQPAYYDAGENDRFFE